MKPVSYTHLDVYKRQGKQTVLYRFKGPPDASHVLTGNLVLDASGSLYGVSYYGGLKSGCAVTTFGCGTFFKLSPKGKGWSESCLLYTSRCV